MFEDLIGDDEIELLREDISTDVELGEGDRLVRLERKRPPVVPGSNFEGVETGHAELVELRAGFSVRDDPYPVGGVEAHCAKNLSKPVAVDVLQHLRP
jgi:hypothetical protein